MKQLKITKLILCLGLFTACSSTRSSVSITEDAEETAETVTTETLTGDIHTQFIDNVQNALSADSYTATVVNSYMMSYSDDTMSAYDLDGVLEVEDANSNPVAHFTQNINSNGLRSTMEGNYYDGIFYNVFNGISYYEEMSLTNLQLSMLVPLRPVGIAESLIGNITGTKDSLGNITYTITLSNDTVEDFFLDRYDQYGLDEYDGFEVNSGTVIDIFDENGYFLSEQTVFETTVTLSGQEVKVAYTSEVTYQRINETTVTISDEDKAAEAEYVSYSDVDTSEIETLSSDDDSVEDTVVATFAKRLVSRLNYELQDDGTYVSYFNNDNEKYMVNFDQTIFEYANRTIHYVYNWTSDVGYMGSCNVDFDTDFTSEECVDTTVETIKEVKSWLEMELYYCGLTLEDLQKETK